jgi:hypothetical protein
MTKNPVVFTGEQGAPPAPPDFEAKLVALKTAWHKQVPSTLDFCGDLGDCREMFPDRKSTIMRELGMSRPVFAKLCAIGKAKHLRHPEIAIYLPPHYSLIYELTKLCVQELEKHIASGSVHPAMSRKDVKALLPANVAASSKKSASSRLEIEVDWSLPEYQQPDFQRWLRNGQDQFPNIAVNWPKNPELNARSPGLEVIS